MAATPTTPAVVGNGSAGPLENFRKWVMIRMDSRDEWLQWRSTGIGASDIAGILGISPWASAYSIWAQKSMNVHGDNPPNAEAMRWGTLLEDAILKETARRLDIRPHSVQQRCTHRKYPIRNGMTYRTIIKLRFSGN
jgi:predicted phage-related endonuclease